MLHFERHVQSIAEKCSPFKPILPGIVRRAVRQPGSAPHCFITDCTSIVEEHGWGRKRWQKPPLRSVQSRSSCHWSSIQDSNARALEPPASGIHRLGPAFWRSRARLDHCRNPYVGCEHGCRHCYYPAMPGVKFFNHGHSQREWGTYLCPKGGIVEALLNQLHNFTPDKAKRTEWGDGWVLMSFLTDCYTPAEAKHRITRRCLQVLLEAGHKVRVQTRSVLVERDFDILTAYKSHVLLGTSLPHLDDKLARCLEPRAAAPPRRLKMLEKAALDIPVYTAVAPFLPFHDVAKLEQVISAVQPLRPGESALSEHYPDLAL